jgi:hypothetical protein
LTAEPSESIAFTCNVCGARTSAIVFGREGAPCERCGSTVRMRAAIRGLSHALFGAVMPIHQFPRRPARRGIGISDWEGYARRLRRVFSYRNTFLHRKPRLDVMSPPAAETGKNDFVVAIDVFEHVPPPVRRAFEGAISLLKRGGVFVFSAPYTGNSQTVEHFPDLGRHVVTTLLGRPCLVYESADGRLRLRTDLTFHGGEGATLEMRLFSRDDIIAHLTAAGCVDIRVLGDAPEWGILYDNDCSHTIIAVRA